MAYNELDEHFSQFARSLKTALSCYEKVDDEAFLARQKLQMDTLIALEKDFRLALISHSQGVKIYREFVKYICETRRNILDARPYFRERQTVFTAQISQALRGRSARGLFKFRFNFRFVQFVLQARKWKPGSKIVKLADAIKKARNEIVVMNMPLAISRARIFYSRTPKSHLSHMDLVQISAEGLMSGVDKFVPPFSRSFRAMALGRMIGNQIEEYNQTLIHYFPGDKRKLYRANKGARFMVGGIDHEQLTKQVNNGVEKQYKTNPSELANLMAAASPVSTDTPVGNEEDGESIKIADRFAAPTSCQPDVMTENQEALGKVSKLLESLSLFDRKLLRLKGIELDSLYSG